MKELSIEEKAQRYDEIIEGIQEILSSGQDSIKMSRLRLRLQGIFPELKESEDELKWLTRFIQEEAYSLSLDIRDDEDRIKLKNLQRSLAWLEKQGKKEQDARYEDLEELLAADNIYQMAMNDEMIREAKEKAVNALHGMCIGRLLGIEKQGEQNLIMAKSPQLGEQKPADKVEPKDFNGIDPHFGKPADKAEPKFRVRDWIVRDGKILQISHIDKVLDGTFHYWFAEGTWLSSAKMEDAHLWTIEDAKDGDVLADNLGVILFKSIRDNNVINYYAYLSGLFAVQKDEEYWGYAVNCTLSPATKEQRERFFAAMHDAGYEWDAEKRELKKIEQKQEENKRNLGGISSNWSEEDENEVAILEAYIRSKDWSESHIGRALGIVNELVNKCKSSKDRVQPKQEWSEEDEKLTNSHRSMVRYSLWLFER